MNIKAKSLLVALVLPIFALGGLTTYKALKRANGVELILPITGYDPRDLLSGHYLIYRLDFPDALCADKEHGTELVYVCVRQAPDGSVQTSRLYALAGTESYCTSTMKGACDGNRFVAGVERFYIPEEHSAALDQVVRGWGQDQGRAKIVVSVGADGQAMVKDLLIDDKPWQEFAAKAKREQATPLK